MNLGFWDTLLPHLLFFFCPSLSFLPSFSLSLLPNTLPPLSLLCCIILFSLFLGRGAPYDSDCWPFLFIHHHSLWNLTWSHYFKYYLDSDFSHSYISGTDTVPEFQVSISKGWLDISTWSTSFLKLNIPSIKLLISIPTKKYSHPSLLSSFVSVKVNSICLFLRSKL